ncbi:MAG: hypothetical protein RLZZ244_38 [Verrucomicrobiota bacterium]
MPPLPPRSEPSSRPPVALAHHWLLGMRGGEKVLEQFCHLFPGAPIHTLVARPEALSRTLRGHPLVESLLAKIPLGGKYYRHLLPLYPKLVSQLQVQPPAPLVLISDAALIKGLSVPPDSIKVCYCHSPPRYLWGLQDAYLQQNASLGPLGRTLLKTLTPLLQHFDYRAAQGVHAFIANSEFIRARIQTHYQRDSTVIHPPVALDHFRHDRPREDFYLLVSEMVPYKRVDLAVQAFNALGKKLVVIGSGPELRRIRSLAKPHITFLGRQPFPVLKDHFERCRAFVFPSIEDFGITPLEAQAAGAPVLALGIGGALETVLPQRTGAFFAEQSVECLLEALRHFSPADYRPEDCRSNAAQFHPALFREKIRRFLTLHFPHHFANYPWPNTSALDALPPAG